MLNFISPSPNIVLFLPCIRSVASPSMTFLLHIYSQVCIIRFFVFIIPIVLFLPVSQEWRTMGITAQEGSGQPGVGAGFPCSYDDSLERVRGLSRLGSTWPWCRSWTDKGEDSRLP